MGFRSILYKLKTGISRLFATSLPTTTQAKRYGDRGEEQLTEELLQRLPGCSIKQNVMIDTPQGKAEIDCLVLYKNKLFAIEIKHWKGNLIEQGESFIQNKTDQWTGEIHSKQHRSPFKQLGRSIHLLRTSIPDRVWINGITYFADADKICVTSDNIWFQDIHDLIHYIDTSGTESLHPAAFFRKCIAADMICAKGKWNTLRCIICDNSLKLDTPMGTLYRKDISTIEIKHHFTYDTLLIQLRNGTHTRITIDNGKIRVFDNGKYYAYALCKLDYIEIGNEICT